MYNWFWPGSSKKIKPVLWYNFTVRFRSYTGHVIFLYWCCQASIVPWSTFILLLIPITCLEKFSYYQLSLILLNLLYLAGHEKLSLICRPFWKFAFICPARAGYGLRIRLEHMVPLILVWQCKCEHSWVNKCNLSWGLDI